MDRYSWCRAPAPAARAPARRSLAPRPRASVGAGRFFSMVTAKPHPVPASPTALISHPTAHPSSAFHRPAQQRRSRLGRSPCLGANPARRADAPRANFQSPSYRRAPTPDTQPHAERSMRFPMCADARPCILRMLLPAYCGRPFARRLCFALLSTLAARSLELGRILYDTLFGLAPNVQPLFKRPRDAIAIKCAAPPAVRSPGADISHALVAAAVVKADAAAVVAASADLPPVYATGTQCV